MTYEKTELYFLRRDVLLQFGEEEGEKIFARASKLCTELIVTTDYKGSAALEGQMRRLVFPVIAYYKTLLAFGYKKSAALGLVRKETEKAAKECAEVLANQNRKIFPYLAFRRNIKRFMESKFPKKGWNYADFSKKGKKISFRITACNYFEVTKKFGCYELCKVFCEYEKIAFAGLSPKIDFSCGGVLADGHSCCEFCFEKGGENPAAEQ